MGYRVVDPEEIEPAPDRPCELRRLSEAAGLDRMAINRYRAAPGEQIPLAYHYHDEQEEAFYVISGTLSVETPEETYRVEADQFFVAEPGSPHRAHVGDEAEGPARVIGVGAPPVSDGHSYEGE